ncbi:F0F1 ATP synthase subunit delta [Patescibacteria group bacterium]|nr:F0F1 ATP synthase subunit delta [Patescibacteria group bacterium]
MINTLKVTATSAIELTPKQAEIIVNAVEKKNTHGTKIELSQVVDPSVIAGIKITIGSEQIDATVITKLEKLQTQLRENI